MKYVHLIWKNLWRRKLRTFLTILSTLVAFVLFGLLAAVRTGFLSGIDVSGVDRLVVRHKVTFILPLPVSYRERLAAVPGVEEVTHATWFGGVYREPKNFFPQMAVDAPTYLDLYPEYRLPEAQKKAWLADRTGAIIGRATADRFGWKIGDRVPLEAPWPKKDGKRNWEFVIDGIYEGAQKETDTSSMFFHNDYFREALATRFNSGTVGWYMIRIADPARSDKIGRQIDAMFANSPAETKTETEKEMAKGFANQVGDIGTLVTWIVAAVFITLLLVVGNTMALSIRERTGELAVLKTLGFAQGQVLALVLAESCAAALLGAVLGLLLALAVIPGMATMMQRFLPVFFVPAKYIVLGLGLGLLLGLAAGLPPAMQAMRLRIVDALRRV